MSAGSQVASGQILGRREKQEDRAGVGLSADGARVFVLADGMGGHASGEVAAALATETFLSAMRRAPASEKALAEGLSAVNSRIRDAAAADDALNGMGCTLLGTVVTKQGLRWISVGDSPLFLLRGGHLKRLNQDHSMREILDGMVQAGRLSADDAAHDPNRNALRSAVSGDEIELVDAPGEAFALEIGDVVLLTSDGIETLKPDEIAHIATNASGGGARKIVDRLLSAVRSRRREYQDNTSVIAYLHGAAPAPRRRKGVIAAAAMLGLAAALSAAAVLLWPANGPTASSVVESKVRNHAPR